MILARSSAGAARAMLDPVMARLAESGAPALLLSGDPHEGALVRGVRAEPLPPGRGRLLRRRGRPALVQLGLAEPLHEARSRTSSTLSSTRARQASV